MYPVQVCSSVMEQMMCYNYDNYFDSRCRNFKEEGNELEKIIMEQLSDTYNHCVVCFTTNSSRKRRKYCEIDSKMSQLLLQIFGCKYDDIGDDGYKICEECSEFVQKAETFKKMVLQTVAQVRQQTLPVSQEEESIKSESEEPGSDDSSMEEWSPPKEPPLRRSKAEPKAIKMCQESHSHKPTCVMFYFCRECGEKFTNSRKVGAHKATCKGTKAIPFNPKFVNGMWECCGVAFGNETMFKTHRKTLHSKAMKEKKFSCATCDQKFNHVDLLVHERSAKCGDPVPVEYNPQTLEDGSIKCCGRVFKKTAYHHHKEKVHRDVMKKLNLMCNFCGAKFKGRKDSRDHKLGKKCDQSKKEYKPRKVNGKWECCGITLDSQVHFLYHRKLRHPEFVRKPDFGPCLQCHMKFVGTLKNHQSSGECVAQGKIEYKPEKIDGVWWCCGKDFTNINILRWHKQKYHRDAIRKVISFCKCGKKFQSTEFLNSHKKSGKCRLLNETLTTEGQQNPGKYDPKRINGKWHCCKMIFADKNRFNSHKGQCHPEFVRKDIVQFCKKCHQKFDSQKSFRSHKSDGTCIPKVIPFNPVKVDGGWQCCGKKFTLSNGFYLHKRNIHPESVRGMNKFHCGICGAQFENNGALWVHKKENKCHIPSKKLPFDPKPGTDCHRICCGMPFSVQRFMAHKRAAHPEIVGSCDEFQCSTCGAQFENKGVLYAHKKENKCHIPFKKLPFDPKPGTDCYRICCGISLKKQRFMDHKRAVHPEHVRKV